MTEEIFNLLIDQLLKHDIHVSTLYFIMVENASLIQIS